VSESPTNQEDPTPSERTRLFHILHKNLAQVRPEYAARDVILCPLCLREMRIDDGWSVEHIIPQNVLKADPDFMKPISLSRRAGLTVLCREKTTTKSGEVANQGCNGWKGQKYDRLFRGMLQGRGVSQKETKHRHGVAILMMAYLGAFQRLGYGYILAAGFDEIRLQFVFPDTRITQWLGYAQILLTPADPNGQVWATTSGLPFVFGGSRTSDAPLEVMFRRFSARLPSGHWQVANLPQPLLAAIPPA
jgi:hypothetical protein